LPIAGNVLRAECTSPQALRMTEVVVIGKPDLEGKRLAFALAEGRVAHCAEFRDFVVRTFELDRKGLAEPGFVRAPSVKRLAHRPGRRN
jgi:hypothetical protein